MIGAGYMPLVRHKHIRSLLLSDGEDSSHYYPSFLEIGAEDCTLTHPSNPQCNTEIMGDYKIEPVAIVLFTKTPDTS